MSRSTRTWFRLAVPALLVIASIVGGLGPVPGASGQVIATATPTATPAVTVSAVASVSPVATAPAMADVPGTSTPAAVVATTPVMAVASGTATTVVGVPTSVATVVATPDAVATGSVVAGTATVMVTGTSVAGTVTPVVSPVATAGAGVPPAGAAEPPGMPGMPGNPWGGLAPTPQAVTAVQGTVRSRDAVSGPFTSLEAGGYHTCGLTSVGNAYCWGRNSEGQLGDGTTDQRTTPVAVSGGLTFTSLVAGSAYTCGLSAGGTAYCWGYNVNGQLGDGTSGNIRTAPVAMSGGMGFTSLEAGGYHTCGLTSIGNAYCWGANWSGQLGDGTSDQRTTPVAVSGGWTFSSLVAGGYHTCGLTSGGTAYCWGQNYTGQLGDGTSYNYRTAPVAVSGGRTFTSLVAGFYHTCGLTSGGTAYCWGNNLNGQLGGGTIQDRTTPVAVSPQTFTSLVAGAFHTCSLTSGGTAYCWGNNGFGQIGDGTNQERTSPVAVSGGLAFTSLVAGAEGYYTCGLTTGGMAYCWGWNNYGQIGDGTTDLRTSPVAVDVSAIPVPTPVPTATPTATATATVSPTPGTPATGKPFTSLVAGYAHTCGLSSSGTAYCWGYNWNGQLGDGTNQDRTSPVAVSGGRTFTSLVAGDFHTCGLTSGGTAYCWGANIYGGLGDGTSANGNWGTSADHALPVPVSGGLTFTSLVAGALHTCGLTSGGTAYCWGLNNQGQLGDGTTTNRTSPVAVSGGRTFTSLEAGAFHTCGLTSGGTAYCWGWNWAGQLGDGTNGTNRTTPVAVSGGSTFTSLATGFAHTCGLTSGGSAFCWGNNQNSQLGDGTNQDRTSPVAVSGGLTFTSLEAGARHTCGLTSGGTAYCWGANWNGGLGDGTSGTDRSVPTAVDVSAIPVPTPVQTATPTATATATATVSPTPGTPATGKPFTSLVAGQVHTCGLTSGGAAYCWGRNSEGQLGDGTVDQNPPGKSSPVAVSGGLTFTRLVAGTYHTCGLTSGGATYCWGANWQGQLGDGTNQDHTTPVAVSGGRVFTSLMAGALHTCGLTSGGTAYCWGWNTNGQLGDGTMDNRTTPVAVTGGLTFTRLVAGTYHTCGLTSSGAAYCWGNNGNGQFGDGTSGVNGDSSADRTSPVAVSGGLAFSSLDAGAWHTCGVVSAGTAYCWGRNGQGQLGDGTTNQRTTPVAVSGGRTFTSLVAGRYHTCGRVSGGTAFCWGNNEYSQLGDGTMDNRTTPVAVSGGRTFTSLVAGVHHHTCGLTSGGTAYCWGDNWAGQIGDGTQTNRSVPTAVDVSAIPVPTQAPTATAVPTSTASPTATSTASPTPVVTPAIRSIRIANVRDTSFTVSWVTDVASAGSIRWGPDDGTAPTNIAADKRGATGTFTVHFATISGLAPSTRYRFDVVSGSTTDTNGGAHYLVTTGPMLGVSAPDQAFGTVSLRDGSTPASVVVHLTASGPSGTSAPLAALVTTAEQKYWAVNFGNLRTGALDAVFPVTADTVLTVTADGGPDGTAASTATVAVARAGTLALYLSDEVSQPLQAGWNLVALRATPATTTTASMVCTALNAVTAGTAVELDRWINGGWDGHRCGLPVNDFALEPGVGYFVGLTRPVTWTYRGSVVATPATLSLFTGWNLVGASAISGTPSVASTTCSQLNTVQAGTAVELDRWIDGGWEGHRCGLPVNDFTLQAGQGYFIRLTRPATWAPVGAAPVSASSIRNTTEASTPVAPSLGVVRP